MRSWPCWSTSKEWEKNYTAWREQLYSYIHVHKYIYLKGKVNKRVDKCIHMLLKVARDTAFDGLLKIEKGKITYKITAINRRHKSSLLLPATSILSSANNQWNIQSNSSKAVYTVTLDEPECSLKCSLRCNICKICVIRTCPDSPLITATIVLWPVWRTAHAQ